MSIDSREKRFSILNFGDGTHIHATFEADGAIDLDDRQHLLDCYSGIEFEEAVVVVVEVDEPVGGKLSRKKKKQLKRERENAEFNRNVKEARRRQKALEVDETPPEPTEAAPVTNKTEPFIAPEIEAPTFEPFIQGLTERLLVPSETSQFIRKALPKRLTPEELLAEQIRQDEEDLEILLLSL